MAAFDTLKIAGSGLGMHQTWLDSLAHNIANVDTVRPTTESAFQAQMVVAAADPTGGVNVEGIALTDPEGILTYDPDNSLADAEGYVRRPAVDMTAQMSQLIMAQRGFEASAQVTKFAQETYTAAIGIGR